LNGTHHADDIIVEGNINTIQKNTEILLVSKEVVLEMNPEKTKYLLMSGYQKVGQRHKGIKVASKSFEDVPKIKYLGTALTDQNSMH
jgi:hypothetical protein